MAREYENGYPTQRYITYLGDVLGVNRHALRFNETWGTTKCVIYYSASHCSPLYFASLYWTASSWCSYLGCHRKQYTNGFILRRMCNNHYLGLSVWA